MFHPSKIISGGQSGVTRAALEAARECGIATGGWVPRGGLVDDGVLEPENYPELCETESADSNEKAAANVRDSDGTLIINSSSFVDRSSHFKKVRELAHAADKPVLLLSSKDKTPEELVTDLRLWLVKNRPQTLNIDGPRYSEQPQTSKLTRHLILRLFGRIPEPKEDSFLKVTTWSLIAINTGLALLSYQLVFDFNLAAVLIVFFVARAIRKGSHKALRFLTFVFGLVTLFSLSDVIYHLVLFKPYEVGYSRLIPPDSLEFWIYLVTPAVLYLAITTLLALLYRRRQIQFLTRTVKGWTIAIVLIIALSFISERIDPSSDSLPKLSKSQESELKTVIDFYQNHGLISLRNRFDRTRSDSRKDRSRR